MHILYKEAFYCIWIFRYQFVKMYFAIILCFDYDELLYAQFNLYYRLKNNKYRSF